MTIYLVVDDAPEEAWGVTIMDSHFMRGVAEDLAQILREEDPYRYQYVRVQPLVVQFP